MAKCFHTHRREQNFKGNVSFPVKCLKPANLACESLIFNQKHENLVHKQECRVCKTTNLKKKKKIIVKVKIKKFLSFGVSTKVINIISSTITQHIITQYRKFVTLDRFYVILTQTNIETDRQTNFKLSDGININNGSNGKVKLFQRKKFICMYQNQRVV